MQSEDLSKFASEARSRRERLLPYISTELRSKIETFDWLLADDGPPNRDLSLKLRDYVWLLSAACETAITEHGGLPRLLEAEAALPRMVLLMHKISNSDNLVDVWTRRLPRPGYDPTNCPIFIVSSWRSGSTLFSTVLNTHPNIAVLPEVNLLDHFIRNQFPLISELPALYKAPPPIVASQMAVTSALGISADEFNLGFARFVIDICSRYAARKGKERFAIKEMINVAAVDLIDLLFGYSAKFIWIVRHGLDVVASHLARYQLAGHPDVAVFAREWATVNDRLADMYELIGRRGFRLRYEDLLEEPRHKMQELYTFLGERADAEVLSRIEQWDQDSLGGDPKIHSSGGKISKPKPSQWKQWPPTLIQQLGKIVNPTLIRAGYDRVPVPNDL